VKLSRYLMHGLAAVSATAVALCVYLFVTYPADQDPIGLALLPGLAAPFAAFLVVYVVWLCVRSAWRGWLDLSRRDELN
jgi:hypothetical protein